MRKEIFQDKYDNNLWLGKESRSGPGSDKNKNIKLLRFLEDFVIKNKIKSIVDLGCGDFNWMQDFNFNLIDSYIGVDIVPTMIKDNQEKYADDKIEFVELDIVEDTLPSADLILCKDVLFHLSFDDALKVLSSIRGKYFISTTFVGYVNTDINTGEWRPINLEENPFCLGNPIKLLENAEDRNDKFSNKNVGVWKL